MPDPVQIPNDLTLFHYTYSPYARRIVWYLQLRGIQYAQCIQPPIMPRADLESLNISYRRIPVLTHGRDVYLDTRLMLRRLERAFPRGRLGARTPEQQAIEQLLSRWTTDGGVFGRAVALIPLDLPNMRSELFRRDREQFGGRSWDLEALRRGRPEALVGIRDACELLEGTLLGDGRKWVFGDVGPSLGDIEAIWPFHWLVEMPGALDSSYISASQFPKMFAWIRRFRDVLKEKRASTPKPVTVKLSDVIDNMANGRFHESVGEVDATDPTGLQPGDDVLLYPTDTGTKNKDQGKLLSLTSREIVIGKATKEGGLDVHVHAPRWGFRVVKSGEGKSKI